MYTVNGHHVPVPGQGLFITRPPVMPMLKCTWLMVIMYKFLGQGLFITRAPVMPTLKYTLVMVIGHLVQVSRPGTVNSPFKMYVHRLKRLDDF